VILSIVAGLALGQGLHEAAGTPDWINTVTAAAIAGGLAAATTHSRRETYDAATDVSPLLTFVHDRLRKHLRKVISALIVISDPGRAPPQIDGNSLSDPIISALKRLSAWARRGEVLLNMPGNQRETLAQATSGLAEEADGSFLDSADPDINRAIERLVATINSITAKPTSDFEQQHELGCCYINALMEALHVAHRLENVPRREPPEVLFNKVRLAN
jgi:hypothetical protein